MNQVITPQMNRSALFRPWLTALAAGLAVAVFLFFADRLSSFYPLRESQRGLDDLCGGLIVGWLIYRYERRRSQFLNDRLKIIQLMNHHVRNALQTIVGSAYADQHDEQLNKIQTSICRIEWALREVLPGRVLDDYDENAAEKRHPVPSDISAVVAGATSRTTKDKRTSP
jgi:hypothetical protein